MLRRLDPARMLVLSFALVIATGSWALRQPWAAVPGKQLRWIEAAFTATSAVCVTGLVVRLPADHTVAGQIVIVSLIQIGGIGIITFGIFFSLLLGRRLSLFGRNMVMSSLAQGPWEDFWPLLRTVMQATLAIEGAGAALLAVGWWGEKGVLAIPWGAFHAVSAFCNAGFGLDGANLMPWRGNSVVVLTVGMLIILGGLGFLPMTDVLERWRRGVRRPLTLHTRVVLAVTAGLLVVGWIGFAVLEAGTTLRGLPLKEQVLAVWFQSITPRTAGFNTLDFGLMSAGHARLHHGADVHRRVAGFHGRRREDHDGRGAARRDHRQAAVAEAGVALRPAPRRVVDLGRRRGPRAGPGDGCRRHGPGEPVRARRGGWAGRLRTVPLGGVRRRLGVWHRRAVDRDHAAPD